MRKICRFLAPTRSTISQATEEELGFTPQPFEEMIQSTIANTLLHKKGTGSGWNNTKPILASPSPDILIEPSLRDGVREKNSQNSDQNMNEKLDMKVQSEEDPLSELEIGKLTNNSSRPQNNKQDVPSEKHIEGTQEKKNKNLTITIGSWNLRSLNSIEKAKSILKLNYDITLLQEIWSPKEGILNILEKEICYMRKRIDGYGGSMVIMDSQRLRPLKLPININEDSNIIKINIGGDRNLWISSIYINKKSKKSLLDTLGEVQKVIPQKDWQYLLLGGDWNNNILDQEDKTTQTLKILCKNMGLIIKSCSCLRGKNELDFFVHGSKIKIEESGVVEMKNSDHNSPWIKIQIEKPPLNSRGLRVPDRKLADRITQECLNKSQNGIDFLHAIDKKYKYNRTKLMKTIRIRNKENELLGRILNSNEDDDVMNTVKEYWKEKTEECEANLLQGQLKKAFHFMKSVTKYHEFKRKDGSIVSSIRKEDGTIINDQDEVNKLIIGHLEAVQTSPKEQLYTLPIPFPTFNKYEDNEMDYILSKLYHGKAIAFDGITDILFTSNNKPVTAAKLGDIWNGNMEPHHFYNRLIPLNKAHPDTPTAKDCRPIMISSALTKILESRLREPLETYTVEKLHRGQTGFVPKMGISVNQMRLTQRVKDITNSKRHCFGLFIDFSNAYNTILHSKLFDRLQKVLSGEEIQLIKAIYSRNQIHLGKHSFTPNIGVAQGSIISPFLFNIYSEDLYQTLEKEVDISYDDLMGYADDLLVMCTSLHQLRKCIGVIQEWSLENNLMLNPKKSGIIEFLPRHRTYASLLVPGTYFEGVPVVTEYKYLGLIVDQKLTVNKQLDYIEEKTNHQRAKLWPVLKAFSLSERINLWTILCRPLFEMLIFPYYAERCHANINKVHRVIRKTFKKFCLLKKNVDNETVAKLMNYDFRERANRVVEITNAKWNARIQYRTIDACDYPRDNIKDTSKIWYPKEVTELINLKTALCKKCDTPCSSYHLKESHGVQIPSNKEILELMEYKNQEIKPRKGTDRTKMLKDLGVSLKPFIDSITTLLM